MDVWLLEVRGLEYAGLAFAVSRPPGKCVSGGDWDLGCIEGFRSRVLGWPDLHRLLAVYPQAMEFVELWFLAVAPKYVVDQLVRHRVASWMVSSARHGRVVMGPVGSARLPRGLQERARVVAEELVGECLGAGHPPELCNRLAPPLLDRRILLGKMNLREYAHVYCTRVYRGGQEETRELLRKLYSRLEGECRVCAWAVEEYCRVWGYTKS